MKQRGRPPITSPRASRRPLRGSLRALLSRRSSERRRSEPSSNRKWSRSHEILKSACANDPTRNKSTATVLPFVTWPSAQREWDLVGKAFSRHFRAFETFPALPTYDRPRPPFAAIPGQLRNGRNAQIADIPALPSDPAKSIPSKPPNQPREGGIARNCVGGCRRRRPFAGDPERGLVDDRWNYLLDLCPPQE
jgi:hypothetical protein